MGRDSLRRGSLVLESVWVEKTIHIEACITRAPYN